MIGRGPVMQELFGMIRRLAPHVRTALVTGETGTGKELVARAPPPDWGRARDRRFVTVNCSAVVETLFESELFGHVRGAFTGATENKPGLFELADNGTLFLDEIGELPLTVQAKLLRVLELGEVHRVGSLEPRRVNVHVIAATNRDLRAEVAAGRFRSDLYYRLNIVEVKLPALRDRREDIPYLTAAFVRETSERLQKPLVGLTPGAERLLGAAALGRQRPRAAQRDRARVHPGRRRLHHRDASWRSACRRSALRRRCAVVAPAARAGRRAAGRRPAGHRRARAHPARAAARARQQEGGGADARPQPPRALPPARTARSRRHDHAPPRTGRSKP